MSAMGVLTKADFKTASDGLLELCEDRLRSIMRTEPITDVYHVEERPFARGKFASVRKIRHLRSGVEYAAKFIRKRRRAADATREIHHEVAVLALCSHSERVVKLHEVYETASEVAIVLELCAGGELQRVLDEEERLPERCARRALRHALEGLQHMHSRRVAHLDLKPQNLLLSADKGELLICDFGISRAILPGTRVREILGTRDYVAPEILSYEPLSLAADIWSVGVLAYVLLSGYSPFAGETKQETYLNIAQCQLSFPRDCFTGVSPLAKKFIRETLVVDPKGRLTVDECLAHPWLKDDAELPCTIVGVGFGVTTDNDDARTDDSDREEAPATTCPTQANGHRVPGDDGHPPVNGCTLAEHHKDSADERPTSPACASNGTNGTAASTQTHAQTDECGEEREKPLKHPHGRETSPPFPDAPSTPKVSRKSHPHPPSVLALCKKFQPDYEKPAKLAHQHAGADCGCGYECGGHACLRPRAALPPDRAVIC